MIPNSAFITIGESEANMAKVLRGESPGAEYAVLRRNHFSKVLAMVDSGADLGAFGAQAKFALRSYFETWNQENIYLGEEFPGIQYLTVHAVLRRRKRIAMLIHNVASLRRRVPLGTLRLARLIDRVFCLSERSRLELESEYGLESSRITVIGSRVDVGFFKPDDSVLVQRQVCSAGAVNRDYETLIEAIRPLDVACKIAADTAWAHSAGEVKVGSVPASVELRSWGNYRNLRELYAQSAVVVIPLKKAMLSGVTVALEAMAMGRPVILTHNPYVEEFMVDGETGYFVPAGDVRALRSKIEYLLEHPDEAAVMGAKARERVLERFTVEQYVTRILSAWD